MGRKVIVAADAEHKKSITITTEAAATLTVGDTNLVVWIGNNVEIIAEAFMVTQALEKCLNALRDASATAPTLTGQVNQALATFGAKTNHLDNVTVTLDTILGAGSEDQVGIYVGALFQPTNSASITAPVRRAVEVWREQVAKSLAA